MKTDPQEVEAQMGKVILFECSGDMISAGLKLLEVPSLSAREWWANADSKQADALQRVVDFWQTSLDMVQP